MNYRLRGSTSSWMHRRRLILINYKLNGGYPIAFRMSRGIESRTADANVFFLSMRKGQIKKAMERVVRILDED